jgi:hypothetical protein
MKKPLLVGLVVAFLMPFGVRAQSDFDGSWKIDLTKSSVSSNPKVFLLQNGTYQCKSCVPVINVKADGTDQNVAGSPYFDTVSIKAEDDRSIVDTRKKGGKVVATSKTTVSPDGTTAIFEFTDSRYSNADPVIGKGSMLRVGKGKRPAAAHAISGSWRISKLESLSENALVFTLKVEDDTLNMTNTTGQSYAAKLDATDAPYKGDPGITTVSVRRLGKLTIEETDKRDGKAIRVKRLMKPLPRPSLMSTP